MRRLGLPAALIALVALLPTSGASARPSATTADRYTPLIEKVFSTPRWFRAPDGRIHLAYELELFNGIPADVQLRSVIVRSAGRKRPLLRLRGRRLLAVTSPLTQGGDASTTIAGSSTSVVWLEVMLPRGARVPRAVRHRITFTVPPGLPIPRRIA